LKALEKIRAAIKRRGADVFLVTQPENRRYLSGYTATDLSISESSGVLLIPVRDTPPFLLTDSRYQIQAEEEASGFEIVRVFDSILKTVVKILRREKLSKLAFESHYILYSSAEKLKSSAKKHGITLVPVSQVIERQRIIKTAAEREKIKQAVLLNEKVFQEIYKGIRPGQTEKELALKIETTMKALGAEEPAFPTIVAAGENGARPHAVPTERSLHKGETIIIDMGLKLDGYCSDMTRTIVLGELGLKTKEIIRLVRKAQQSALKSIKAGITAREADQAARQIIKSAGYGKNFGHGLGHGVGLAVHEPPSLNSRRRNKLQTGMVVTVEPGIYIPGWGGVRLENMVIVEDNGCTVLNRDTTFLDI
jgi:Xaa-Pro aminopeptidase